MAVHSVFSLSLPVTSFRRLMMMDCVELVTDDRLAMLAAPEAAAADNRAEAWASCAVLTLTVG
jgi:hypothetical protein